MAKLAEMGFRDLTLASSSLIDAHWPLIEHIKNGVVRQIYTSGLRGKLGEEISAGLMERRKRLIRPTKMCKFNKLQFTL